MLKNTVVPCSWIRCQMLGSCVFPLLSFDPLWDLARWKHESVILPRMTLISPCSNVSHVLDVFSWNTIFTRPLRCSEMSSGSHYLPDHTHTLQPVISFTTVLSASLIFSSFQSIFLYKILWSAPRQGGEDSAVSHYPVAFMRLICSLSFWDLSLPSLHLCTLQIPHLCIVYYSWHTN